MKKFSMTLILATLASQSFAQVITSGLAENFEASTGANTTTFWENQVGSRDLIAVSDENNPPIALGSVTSSRTTIDTAYQFDGSAGFNDNQTVGPNVFSSLDNSNSFEIWFRPNDLTGGQLYESGGGTGMQIFINGDGEISGYFENGIIKYDLSQANLGYDPISDFTQVVFTADSADSANGTKLYVNGSLVSQGGAANWNGTGDNDGLGEHQWAFGDGTATDPGVFNGDISTFRIYEDILSDTEVSANYDAVAVPEPSSFALIAGFLGLTWVMLRRRS